MIAKVLCSSAPITYFPSCLILLGACPWCCMCRSHPRSPGLNSILCSCHSSVRKHVAPLSMGSDWHHPFAWSFLLGNPTASFQELGVGSVGSGSGEMFKIEANTTWRDHQLTAWQPWHATGMDLPPWGGDGLLEWHIPIKGASSSFSACPAEYPPPSPDRVVSGVTSSTNSSLTSECLEHLKAFLSQQTSFSILKLTSLSSRCNKKKTQSQESTYRAAPSEAAGMGGKLVQQQR